MKNFWQLFSGIVLLIYLAKILSWSANISYDTLIEKFLSNVGLINNLVIRP